MYSPLPDYLIIGDSKIHGQGVFAIDSIPKDTSIGVTHVYIDHKIIRTPLGGFVNHDVQSNCVLEEGFLEQNDEIINIYKCKNLKATRLIHPGEEITLTYKMYDPSK